MVARGIGALFSTGELRRPQGWLTRALTVWSLVIAAFGFWSNLSAGMEPYLRSALFLSAMLPLAFLLYSPTKASMGGKPAWFDYLLSLLSITVGIYIFLQSERLLLRWPTVDPLTTADWFFGVVIVFLALEATRRMLGPGLTIVVLIFVLYTLFGHLLPGQFYHRPISLTYYIDTLAFTINGINGSTTNVAATYVFMFVGFGVFLDQANGGLFFSRVANALAGSQVGGPAKIAVISSGLYGTISGSPTADVMTTGSFTIPLMKRMGFNPIFAGAVEAVASTGGAVLPPVMGSAAFLMVELTGTPYRDLAIAAFLPAILYYLGVYWQVHFHSARLGLRGLPKEQLPRLRDALFQSGEFILPFAVLIYLLLSGYSPAYTAIAGILTTIAVSWFRPENRLGLRKIIVTIDLLVRRLTPVTAACAAAGLVISGITTTGFGGRMITLINSVAGDSAFIALLIAAVVSIILGMGMPIPAVYILVSVILGPALIDRGISLMAAHLFLIYFSAMSAITPPVAVAAYSAASIAEADPMRIGWTAVRLGIAAFIVPFIFVYNNALILQGTIPFIVWSALTALIGITGIAAGIEGFALRRMTAWERLFSLAGGLTLVVPGLVTDLIGLGLLAIVLFNQKLQAGRVGESQLNQ